MEDDIFADFEDEAAPRLAAFDELCARVVSIGSFSKDAFGGGALRLYRLRAASGSSR